MSIFHRYQWHSLIELNFKDFVFLTAMFDTVKISGIEIWRLSDICEKWQNFNFLFYLFTSSNYTWFCVFCVSLLWEHINLHVLRSKVGIHFTNLKLLNYMNVGLHVAYSDPCRITSRLALLILSSEVYCTVYLPSVNVFSTSFSYTVYYIIFFDNYCL